MSKRSTSKCTNTYSVGLDCHLEAFLETLACGGYLETTCQAKRRHLAQFVQWLQGRSTSIKDIDELCVSSFLQSTGARPYRRGSMGHATLRQFVKHLRGRAMTVRGRPEPSPNQELMGRYQEHLRNARGLADRTISTYRPYVSKFVAAHQLRDGECSLFLDAASIRHYLLDAIAGRSSSHCRLLTIALRSFLRFLFFDAMTGVDLSTAVPPLRRWRLATIPQRLSGEEVERVIAVAAADCSTEKGIRAYAMLLLLARLGLRPGEVATLELDDLHWRTGELIVRGKGGRHDSMPLLEDVGGALLNYLQHSRGHSDSRMVFLRLLAPRVGLSGPTAVCDVARKVLDDAGLLPAGRVGAHIFRHSLATRMIGSGASLSEIAQVLRHRQVETSRIYAKVAIDALRRVAQPWPGNGGNQ